MKQIGHFNKERGLKGCISAAWHMFSLYINKELRQFWPLLALVGLSSAFVVETLRGYVMNHALPALRLWQSGQGRDVAKYLLVPDLVEAVIFVVVFIVSLLGLYWLKGRTAAFLLSYSKGKAWMPTAENRLCAKEDRTLALRLFWLQLPVYIITFALSALVVWLASRYSWWLMLVLVPLLCYAACGKWAASAYRVVYGLSYGDSLFSGYAKHWGKAFSALLLCAIPTCFVRLLLLLPVAIYILASFAAADSKLIGDEIYLPRWVEVTCFFVNAVALAFYAFSSLFSSYALTLRLNNHRK